MKNKTLARFNLSQLLALIGLIFTTFTWMSGGIEAIAYAFYSFIILILFLLMFIKRKPNITKFNKLSSILLAFILICSFSIIWSINRFDTTIGVLTLIIAALVYEVTIGYLADQNLFSLWKYIYIVFATASVFWGVPNYFLNNTDGRFVTPIYWPNVAAVALAPAIFLSFYGFAESKKKLPATLYLAASSIMGTAFILTFSRGSFIAMAAMLIALLALFYKNKKFVFVILATILISVLMALGLYQVRNLQFKNAVNINITSKAKASTEIVGNSVSDRSNYWRSSVTMIKDRPIWGSGYNTFKDNYPSYQKNASAETNDPHSFLLKAISEVGLIYLIIFAVLVVYLLTKSLKKLKDLEFIAILASALMILGHAMIDIDLSYPAIIFTLSLFLGLIAIRLADFWELGNFKLFKGKAASIIIWLLLFMIATSTSIICFNYFMVKNQEESLLFFVYDRDQDRLDVISASNSYWIVNPNNLSGQAELLINMALSSKDKSTSEHMLQKASDLINTAISQDKYDAKNYFLRARLQEIKGENQEALLNYKKSNSLNPYNDLLQHLYYIRLLMKMGLKEKALQASSDIIDQYNEKTLNSKIGVRPYFAQFLSELLKTRALLYYEKGQNGPAIKDLERAKALNSTDTSLEDFKNTILKTN